MSVLIVSLFYIYGWLCDDNTIKTHFMICETPGQCGMVSESCQKEGVHMV